MAITTDNPQSVNTPLNQTVQTLSSYAVSSGSDKILVVASSNSNNIGTSANPTATFNGNSMTLVRYQPRTWRGSLAFFYYLLGSSTPTGDIVVTWDKQANLGWAICALTLIGAAQQAPEATGWGGTTSGTTISNNVTSVTANAMIIDAARCDVTGTAFTADSSQTIEMQLGNDSANRSVLGSRLVTTAQLYSLQWTAGNNDKQQILTAWEEAAGGGPAPQLYKSSMRGVNRGVLRGVAADRYRENEKGLYVPDREIFIPPAHMIEAAQHG